VLATIDVNFLSMLWSQDATLVVKVRVSLFFIHLFQS